MTAGRSSSVLAGRALGLLAALVVTVPIVIAVLLLTEFSILEDTDDGEPTASTFIAAAAGTTEPIDGLLQTRPLDAFVADAATPLADEPEPAPTEATGAADTYVVVAGDTLAVIARRFETSVDKIAAYNAIADPNALRVGQELRIPPASYELPPPPPGAAETVEAVAVEEGSPEAEVATGDAETAPEAGLEPAEADESPAQ